MPRLTMRVYGQTLKYDSNDTSLIKSGRAGIIIVTAYITIVAIGLIIAIVLQLEIGSYLLVIDIFCL